MKVCTVEISIIWPQNNQLCVLSNLKVFFSCLITFSNLGYCKPFNIGGYLIWRFLPSGYIDCYLNWRSFLVFSMKLMQAICIGGDLIRRFLGPSQIHQLKSPPNINCFTVIQKCQCHRHESVQKNPKKSEPNEQSQTCIHVQVSIN